MGGVDEPVADRVGKRGLTDHVMPGVDGKLTGDEVDARSVRSSRTSSRSWRSGVVSGARPQSSITSNSVLANRASRRV